MNKLFEQIIKFGVVGFLCFFIDYLIGLAVMNIIVMIAGDAAFTVGSIVGSIAGFTISLIVNYFLSMKFVFKRKEDLDRKYEFIAFTCLSIIGLGINSFLVWVVVDPLYNSNPYLQENFGYSMMYTGAKVFATAIVMVYNFITRKIFLEERKHSQA